MCLYRFMCNMFIYTYIETIQPMGGSKTSQQHLGMVRFRCPCFLFLLFVLEDMLLCFHRAIYFSAFVWKKCSCKKQLGTGGFKHNYNNGLAGFSKPRASGGLKKETTPPKSLCSSDANKKAPGTFLFSSGCFLVSFVGSCWYRDGTQKHCFGTVFGTTPGTFSHHSWFLF